MWRRQRAHPPGAEEFHRRLELADAFVLVSGIQRLFPRVAEEPENFMDLVEASKHYPCVKRAWVEYLGEHPDPEYDRVQ
jgi:hypothetical protein